jgi:hypothetical protein
MMIHRLRLIFCCMLAIYISARAEDSPTTLPAQSETLLAGAIIYLPPADWKFLGKRGDDRSVGYQLPPRAGQIVIVVTPQTQTVPDELGPKLGMQIGQTIRAEAAKGNIQIISQPKVEEDKRFLLKVHDQFKTKGQLSDRTQLFRGVGKNLVSVTVNALTDDADQQKQIEMIGEQVMLSVRLNRPGATAAPQVGTKTSGATTRPVLFSAARLRVTPPLGWNAEPTDRASGLIVTWRDPAEGNDLIALSCQQIPTQLDDDPKMIELAVEQTVASEKPVFDVQGAQAIGSVQTISDKRFLKKTRAEYQLKDAKLRVTFRQLRAGDAVVSVTGVSTEEHGDEVDALGDQVAAEVRATR